MLWVLIRSVSMLPKGMFKLIRKKTIMINTTKNVYLEVCIGLLNQAFSGTVRTRKNNFLISQPKHMLWVLKRIVSMRQFFEHQKHMLTIMGKKIFTLLH